MRTAAITVLGVVLLGAAIASADDDRPDLSGTWKLNVAQSKPAPSEQQVVMTIEENGDKLHLKETRGLQPKKDDVSEFTCTMTGEDCPMLDGGHKAKASAYYNGPVLVVFKTNEHRGGSVEKWRLSLAPKGDSLTKEITHIQPQQPTETLVFSREK